MEIVDFATRWLHVLFGIAWIGLLYYFNLIQGEYFKQATPDAKADATAKLVPRALFYFRWAAMLTFITGLVLLVALMHGGGTVSLANLSMDITLGALMGTLMMLNVWLIIWPNQRIVIAGQDQGGVAAGKALVASRTNTALSIPMLYCMISSGHQTQGGVYAYSHIEGLDGVNVIALSLAVALIALIELNAVVFKKMSLGPVPYLQQVSAVTTTGFLLTVIFAVLLNI